MISVIVPVYKVEKYLDKCVSSIVNQSCRDLEIILVDDGSPDNCPEMCDAWAVQDSRIKVIHQKNGGLSAARNAGLKMAVGEYIGFVDSDDYIEPDMYEQLFKNMQENESDIAVCGCFIADENGKIKAIKENRGGVYEQKEAVEVLSLSMNNSAWNKLYKKSIIGNNLFESGRIFGEDHLFLLHILERCKKVSFLNKPLYYYLQRGDSITGVKFNAKAFDQIYMKDALFAFAAEHYPYIAYHYQKLCFTARENLCRKILLSGQETVYGEKPL